MATTSTNKQPLFIDRVFHYVKNLDEAYNGAAPESPDDFGITGNNQAELLVDAIATDGAIIEDLYVISRGAAHTVNLYLSTARDFLRNTQASYIGSVASAATARTVTKWNEMPDTLAPVPAQGDAAKNKALYVPKGYALWAARQGNLDVVNAPLVGCQGGWY